MMVEHGNSWSLAVLVHDCCRLKLELLDSELLDGKPEAMFMANVDINANVNMANVDMNDQMWSQ